MGKVKKMKPSQVGKNVALADQIESSHSVKSKNRNKERNRHDDDDEVSSFILVKSKIPFNLRGSGIRIHRIITNVP